MGNTCGTITTMNSLVTNTTKKLTYRAIIQKDGEGFHGLVPALPGCHTYGYSLDEVRDNLKSAIIGWIEAQQDMGWEVPLDQTLEVLESIELTSVQRSKKKLSHA